MIFLELQGVTRLFQKKEQTAPTNTYPIWHYFSDKFAEKAMSTANRLWFLKSNREQKNCINCLSQQYRDDDDRYRCFEEIPGEIVQRIVHEVFKIYQTLVQLESGKATFDQFASQLNALHQQINEQPYNCYVGVYDPARKYIENKLQFTLTEKSAAQKHFFSALLTCAPIPRTIDHGRYSGNEKIEFQSALQSQVDTLLLTSHMRQQDFTRPITIEEMLLNLNQSASMFGFLVQKLPEPEQQKWINLLQEASPQFRATNKSIEQITGDSGKIYQAELCLFLLTDQNEPLLKAKAAQGLLSLITAKQRLDYTPKLPGALVSIIETKLAHYLVTEYITQLPAEAQDQYIWIEKNFGDAFLKRDFLPYVCRFVEISFPDLLGMVQITNLITRYRKQASLSPGLQKSADAVKFLVYCVSELEGKQINIDVLNQANLYSIDTSPQPLARLAYFSSLSEENSVATQLCAKELLESMREVPLTTAQYSELIKLWTENKNYGDKTPSKNILRNLRRMQALEKAQSGSIEILLQPPFNIRFFDRYTADDLLAMIAKITQLREKKHTSEQKLYDPNKTILVTTGLYDNNDAHYSENKKQFLKQARERGFEVIICEVNSPAQLLFALESFYELNNSQPFATKWILDAHGNVEGSIRLGSKDEPASRFLPSAVTKIMTQDIAKWFGNNKVQLVLNACYSGTHWVKTLGHELQWQVDGQEGSAGLHLSFKPKTDEIAIIATNSQGKIQPLTSFKPQT